MDRWTFQSRIPVPLSDYEWEKIQYVYNNTQAIQTMQQMAEIVCKDMKYVDILYQCAQERGKLIGEIGDLKKEISKVKGDNKKLREFRNGIIKAYKEMDC